MCSVKELMNQERPGQLFEEGLVLWGKCLSDLFGAIVLLSSGGE